MEKLNDKYAQDLWEKVKKEVEQNVSSLIFEVYVVQLKEPKIIDNQLILFCESKMFADTINRGEIYNTILECIKNIDSSINGFKCVKKGEQINIDLLEKAINFATKAHSGTFRKGTEKPFIVHPLEALSIASTMTNNENILCASVLHDTVEDTATTIEDIQMNFGEEVAKLVAFESENKRENLPQQDTWKIRKQETIDMLEKASNEERILVLSDKLSNMRAVYRDYMSLGDNLWERFNQKDKNEQAWYYRSIAEKLLPYQYNFPYAFEEYLALLEKVFGKNGHVKQSFIHKGITYDDKPKSFKKGLIDGDFPSKWFSYLDKWQKLADISKDYEQGYDLKSVYSIFEFNGILYEIDYATFGIKDFQFEHIEREIERDIEFLGGKNYMYYGMID